MNRSEIIRPFGACIAMLLALVLATAGCSTQNASPEQLIASAKQERHKGHYRNAIIHLKSALQNNPQNAEARYLLGVTFNDVRDYQSAEVELRKAMELRYDLAKVKIGKSLLMTSQFQKVLDEVPPDSNVSNEVQAEILTLRGQALIGLRRHPEGRELIEQALKKQPEFADALLVQTRIAVIEGKLDAASAFIERAIASAPRNTEAWLIKGDLAQIKGDKAGALTAYQKVLEISAENIPARENVTSLQIADGSFADAKKGLAILQKTAPNSPRTRYMVALIEFRQKKFSAARDAVLQALKVTPDYLPSIALSGAIEYALGAHAQAQAHLGQVIDRAPGHLYARKILISSLAKSGQTQRAIELLQPALKQAPDDSELLGLAGEMHLQAGDLANAVRYFEKAAKVDPKSVPARTGLGLSRLAAGEPDRAIADLESAAQIESNPDQYQADMLLVTLHMQRREYDAALKALQTLEKKQPKNPLTYDLKGAIYIGKKNEPAARKELERALELSPTFVPAAINLARLDLTDKKPAAARRRFEAILEKDKDNTEALIALADFAATLGATPKETIDWLERARKASPRSLRPQLMLARAYNQAGDAKKALEVAQQAQNGHPDSTEALSTLGALQITTGDRGQAIATFNRIVAAQPKSATALYWLGMAHAANNNFAVAAGALRKALALRPDFVQAQVELAGMEARSGRYPEALKIAQQIQKQNAKSPLGFTLEGDALMAEKNFPQAARAYETAYGLDRNALVLVKLYTAYTEVGKLKEAEERVAQWLKHAPEDTVVPVYVAEASLKSGRYQYAIEQYERLLKNQPDNVLFLNNLAWAYQQVKDQRALQTAERAYKLKPDSPLVADTLGWMLVEQGDTKRGIDLLQKAVTAAPKNPENRYHLAQAFVKAGDQVRARQELEKVVADSSGSRVGKEAKQLLDKLR